MIAASFWGIIAGICVAVQVGLNNTLGKSAPGLWVTLVSHLGGAIFALVLILVGTLFTSSVSRDALAQVASAPWYSFAGGVFGVTIVVCVLASVRVLPIGTTLAMVVAGQLIASVVLERTGALGLQPHPIDAGRLVGIGLICAGTYLMRGV